MSMPSTGRMRTVLFIDVQLMTSKTLHKIVVFGIQRVHIILIEFTQKWHQCDMIIIG